jgi:hypothetical protein
LSKRNTAKEPFDSVKDQIKDHLSRQKRSQFWEGYSVKMRDEAKIEYSDSEKKLREENAQPPLAPRMVPAPQPQAEPKPEAKPEAK